jgi:hypothetical protein
LLVTFVEHLVGYRPTKDWSEAVANLGFRDGIPHIASRLVVMEIGLSSVVGDDVDEGGCRVQQLDQTHFLPLCIRSEMESVRSSSFLSCSGRHRPFCLT